MPTSRLSRFQQNVNRIYYGLHKKEPTRKPLACPRSPKHPRPREAYLWYSKAERLARIQHRKPPVRLPARKWLLR
jgi:hypothetical protein